MADPSQSNLGRMIVDNDSGEIITGAVGAKALLTGAFDDATLEKNSSGGAARVKPGGIGRDQLSAKGGKWVRVDLLDADTAGGIASVANPFGVEVIVTRTIFQITVQAAAACTVDVGLAAGATTSSDTLLDGLDVKTSAGVFGSGDEGTNGKLQREWGSGEFLTASTATGAAASLSGYLAVYCVEISS